MKPDSDRVAELKRKLAGEFPQWEIHYTDQGRWWALHRASGTSVPSVRENFALANTGLLRIGIQAAEVELKLKP